MVRGGGNLLELVEARLRRARAGCEARYLARAGRSQALHKGRRVWEATRKTVGRVRVQVDFKPEKS